MSNIYVEVLNDDICSGCPSSNQNVWLYAIQMRTQYSDQVMS